MAGEVLLSRCSRNGIGADAGAEKWFPAWQIAFMVKRIAPAGLVTFCLLAACGAHCQSERQVPGWHQGLQFEGTTSTQPRRPEMEASQSLPDAPSAPVLPPANAFPRARYEARWPLTVGEVGMKAGVFRETNAAFGPLVSATVLHKAVPVDNRAEAFLGRYLYPSLGLNSRYQPSSSDRFMGRATDAASRIFFTRDESGKRQLNTPYLLRVLTSVAAGSASRRYRARSGSAPLSDFGSTVGNDAGMNLLHEFGPGIRQMVTGHRTQIVSRFEQRPNRQPNPR
jgi:hypothetical protein